MALMDFNIDTTGTPQEVQRKQALADALLKQGMDSSPAAGGKGGGWVTALNRGLAGALGGYQRASAANEESQGRQQARAQLAAALQGGKVDPMALVNAAGDPWANPTQVAAATHMGDMQAQRDRQAIEDKHWAADYSLRQRAAARADEGPVEKAQQRLQLLQSRGIDPNSAEGQAYIISGEWTGPGANAASLTPVYGVKNGKPAMVQTTKSGKAIETQLPEGFEIAKEPIRIDNGTYWSYMDPQTRQIIRTEPKNIAATEAQKVVGEETGKAQVALPQVMASSQQILKTIDDIQNHPGKAWSLGMYSKMPTIPGTEQANFRAATNQLKGQTFLQAYQALRGGGAITDVEGAKGENALARLDQAQTVEAYDKALSDFKEVIHAGMLRASAKARMNSGDVAAPEPPKAPASGAYVWTPDKGLQPK